MRFKKNPKMITKRLGSQVGVLNPETTELFILDELASRVFFQVVNATDKAGKETGEDEHREAVDEQKEILAYLVETGVLLERQR